MKQFVQGQRGPSLDINQTTEVTCDECGNDKFTVVFKVRKVAALLSPSGQEGFVPLQTFECTSCGHINEGFMSDYR
tara:strand:- start:1600 stop:1827 length:228 start_codon:yes stop_codon:yes gene_type:complete